MFPMGLQTHIRNPQRHRVTTSTGSWVNFSPLALGPSMWLDAADTSTITASSGSVSEWRDKSGNARDATQATSANQPTTAVNTQNGLNLLTFNGSSNFFTTPSFTPPATGFSTFVVLNLTSNQNAMIWEQGNTSNNSGRRYFWHSTNVVGADKFVYGYHDGSNFRDYIMDWPFAGGIRIAMGSFEGSEIVSRLSPNNEVRANRTNYPTSASKPIFIGRQIGGVWFFAGTIGEIIVYDYELPRQVRLSVWEYLNNKWRIY